MTSTVNYDSDELVTDDEIGRSLMTSTARSDNVTTPAASRPTSNENTPTAMRRHGTIRASPRGRITQWTPNQCAKFIENLGQEYGRYADAFVDEAVTGEVLVIISHEELKELGIVSTGHRLKVLKAIYQVKVKQNIPFDADHYVPLSAEVNAPDNRPTIEDFSALIQAIKLRDDRMLIAEAELVKMKEHLDKVWDDTRRLRQDMLPVARAVKESSQPLPPEPPKYSGSGPAHLVDIPPLPKGPPPMPHMIDIKPSEGLSRSLSRKLSNKRFPFGPAAKMPSPGTIHEAEAIQAVTSTYLSPGQSLHMTSQQPSPTSPPYTMNNGSIASRTNHRDESYYSNTSSMTYDPRIANPSMSAPPIRRAPNPTPSTNTLSIANSELTTKLGHINAGSGTPLSMVTSATNNADDLGASGLVDRFKVKDQETTQEILPSALRKWNIVGDPRHYNLYIVFGDRERLLTSQERPLMLFKEFQKQDLHPMFMLRKKNNEPDIIAADPTKRKHVKGGTVTVAASAAASRAQSVVSPPWSDMPGGIV